MCVVFFPFFFGRGMMGTARYIDSMSASAFALALALTPVLHSWRMARGASASSRAASARGYLHGLPSPCCVRAFSIYTADAIIEHCAVSGSGTTGRATHETAT